MNEVPAPVSQTTDHALLERARRSEKEQALAYRSMAARAEAGGSGELAQRFHELHADEQHHLSRLTARLLELRLQPEDLSALRADTIPLDDWESHLRVREETEIRLYSELVRGIDDATTRALIESILRVEESHLSELGGKWTMA